MPSSGATIRFLGAAGTVTGSKYLVAHAGQRLLVDCGLFQGRRPLRRRNWNRFAVAPRSIDAVLLTHAHLDHSGYLPRLVRDGFRGPVYCSAATADLAALLLRDAAHLEEADAAYANRKGFTRHRPARPLFKRADVDRALRRLVPVEFGASTTLGPGARATLQPVGHILGAAAVRLQLGQCAVLFSGDVGRPNDPVMPAPAPFGQADVAVVESTYGDAVHPDEEAEAALAGVIQRVAERGGALLIPAFAVGRAHALLYLLQKLKAGRRIPDLPVFLDSPMAISAMEIYRRHLPLHRLDDAACRRTCEVARYCHSAEDSKALNHVRGPRIIVAASGMLTGGRVLHHLAVMGPNPRNALVFIGYQAGGTRGAHLLGGATTVRFHGSAVPVRAERVQINALSAHADQPELLNWLRTADSAPRRVFLTHGEPSASNALADAVRRELGWDAVIPEHRSVHPLRR